jgi:hypothetical protein
VGKGALRAVPTGGAKGGHAALCPPYATAFKESGALRQEANAPYALRTKPEVRVDPPYELGVILDSGPKARLQPIDDVLFEHVSDNQVLERPTLNQPGLVFDPLHCSLRTSGRHTAMPLV